LPLPDSPEISWDLENSLKSNSKPKVIITQPNSSISPVSVDKITDKSRSHSSTTFAKGVVLDTHALLSEVNDNINISTATKADLVIAAPVGQNLPAIELVVQDPVAQGEDPGVGIGPFAPVVPDPVGPVIQGPANAPPVVPLVLDGDNDNDSSEDESMTMTYNVIAPPTFNGKAEQNPSDWLRHFILYSTFKGYIPDRQKSLFKVLLTDGAADWLEGSQPRLHLTILNKRSNNALNRLMYSSIRTQRRWFTRRQGVSHDP